MKICAGLNSGSIPTTRLNYMDRKALTLIGICSLALFGRARAEQGGGGHYVPGATASFIDTLPDKPGLVAENIFLNYNNASVNGSFSLNGAGSPVLWHGLLPFGRDLAVNVNASVNADRVELLYMFQPEILGGHYAIAAAPSFVWEQINGVGIPYVSFPNPRIQRVNPGTASGFGDIEFWPLMLGWKTGDFKYDVRCAVYAPTGNYNQNNMANPGLGYWTFEPGLSLSWLSSRIGTEASVFAGMDFNTKNTDTDYQSGDIVHLDATVAQHLPLFGGSAGLGAGAFYYKQVTADSGGSPLFPGSYEIMSEGVGPVVSYAHNIGGKQLDVEAKWLPQTQVHYTTQGNFVWVKIALLF
jgi:hypothetical protein